MGEHPVVGKIVFPFDGTVILPDFPSGGNGEEIYHWYQDGKDLSILTKDNFGFCSIKVYSPTLFTCALHYLVQGM